MTTSVANNTDSDRWSSRQQNTDAPQSQDAGSAQQTGYGNNSGGSNYSNTTGSDQYGFQSSNSSNNYRTDSFDGGQFGSRSNSAGSGQSDFWNGSNNSRSRTTDKDSDNQGDKARPNATGKGLLSSIMSKLRNPFHKGGYGHQILSMLASQTGFNYGHYAPGNMSMLSNYFSKNVLPKAKSWLEAIQKTDGKKTSQGLPDRSIGWRAEETADGKKLIDEDNPFNPSEKNKNNPNVKTFFIGGAGNGGGRSEFLRGVSRVRNLVTKKFGAQALKLVNNPAELSKAIAQTKAWAKAHPNVAVNTIVMADCHGNNSTRQGKEGDGEQYNQVMGNESGFKRMLRNAPSNMGFHIYNSNCFAGGILA